MLAGCRYFRKYLINVRHVEITAQGKVLCPPVVAAKERMDILYPAFSRGGISQMPHVQFSCERKALLRKLRIMKLLLRHVAEVFMYGREYLRNRS